MKRIFGLIFLLFATAGFCQNQIAVIEQLSRQLLQQQLYREEQARSDGHSGLKQVRVSNDGSRPYHSPSHASSSLASIHDHANNIRTLGMGEFSAVLNGVEFRTRHNDYQLRRPSRSSREYNADEFIPFPAVPPAVHRKRSVQEQIIEMRQWFKAWQNQDSSTRNYKPYFKPVLCYLEGGWTTSTDSLDESFDSDRHFLDAQTWFELQENIRFTSYSGRKDNNENYAYLPTGITNITNGVPVMAQWNYRIMCHPLKGDLPLDRLRLVDDVKSRMAYGRTLAEHAKSRAARFQLNLQDRSRYTEGTSRRGLLDKLMEQVPGKDNYRADLTDDLFGEPAYKVDQSGPINAGYYHRYFRVKRRGAMGSQLRQRGYSDDSIFMAMTSQPQIAPLRHQRCKRRVCSSVEQRWTYAVPLEIIYMTPLFNWNPYNITYKGEAKSTLGRTVTEGGRDGTAGLSTAFNGSNSRVYFRTPAEFFAKGRSERDAADTGSRAVVQVLDSNNARRNVTASGPRIFLPEILGISGRIRLRYPIMPIYGEGSAAWKELEALKDIVLEPTRYWHMFRENVTSGQGGRETKLFLMMAPSALPDVGVHTHEVELEAEDVKHLKADKRTRLKVTTNEMNGHSHELVVQYRCRPRMSNNCGFIYTKCDGQRKCWDKHPKIFNEEGS